MTRFLLVAVAVGWCSCLAGSGGRVFTGDTKEIARVVSYPTIGQPRLAVEQDPSMPGRYRVGVDGVHVNWEEATLKGFTSVDPYHYNVAADILELLYVVPLSLFPLVEVYMAATDHEDGKLTCKTFHPGETHAFQTTEFALVGILPGVCVRSNLTLDKNVAAAKARGESGLVAEEFVEVDIKSHQAVDLASFRREHAESIDEAPSSELEVVLAANKRSLDDGAVRELLTRTEMGAGLQADLELDEQAHGQFLDNEFRVPVVLRCRISSPAGELDIKAEAKLDLASSSSRRLVRKARSLPFGDQRLDLLWKAVKACKHCDMPRLLLGAELQRSGRLEESLEQYKECLRINPENFRAHFNVGQIQLRQRHYADALESFETAMLHATSGNLDPAVLRAIAGGIHASRQLARYVRASSETPKRLRVAFERQREALGKHVQEPSSSPAESLLRAVDSAVRESLERGPDATDGRLGRGILATAELARSDSTIDETLVRLALDLAFYWLLQHENRSRALSIALADWSPGFDRDKAHDIAIGLDQSEPREPGIPAEGDNTWVVGVRRGPEGVWRVGNSTVTTRYQGGLLIATASPEGWWGSEIRAPLNGYTARAQTAPKENRSGVDVTHLQHLGVTGRMDTSLTWYADVTFSFDPAWNTLTVAGQTHSRSRSVGRLPGRVMDSGTRRHTVNHSATYSRMR